MMVFLERLRDHPLVRMIRQWNLFKPVFVCGLGQINTYGQTHKKTELIEKLHKDSKLRQEIEARIQADTRNCGSSTFSLIQAYEVMPKHCKRSFARSSRRRQV